MKKISLSLLFATFEINLKITNMFVQIFRDETKFIMVQVDHIIYLEPHISGKGTTVMLSHGHSFFSPENYNSILENINNLK